MAQVIDERNNAAAKIRIRALAAEGQALNPTRAARDVAELFASDIEKSLRGLLALELVNDSLHALIKGVLEQRLATMLVVEGDPKPLVLDALPVANVRPSEVIDQGLVQLSLASLYRYVDANKFYCVTPPGQTNGRAFPVWQFVEPVPELLPAVLDSLRGALKTEVHAFLVTARDELNELSPAEMLAGKPFVSRTELHSSQRRLLQRVSGERLRRVLDAVPVAGEGMAY